jgi:hypothetical protein
MFEDMTGHFGDHSGAHAQHRLGQQPLDIPTGVLDFVERTFNPFTDTIQPEIEGFRVLVLLVAALDGPNLIAGLLIDLELPFLTDEAFIGKDRTAGQLAQHRLSRRAFVGTGWHQLIDHR